MFVVYLLAGWLLATALLTLFIMGAARNERLAQRQMRQGWNRKGRAEAQPSDARDDSDVRRAA